jgi:hypothetical protein
MNRKRDKLKAYKEVIETPDFIINRFEEPAQQDNEIDPFYTVDSLKEEKNKARQDTE